MQMWQKRVTAEDNCMQGFSHAILYETRLLSWKVWSCHL